MTGSSVAHHLLTEAKVGEGLDVVMLEAREACWGATGRVSLFPIYTQELYALY